MSNRRVSNFMSYIYYMNGCQKNFKVVKWILFFKDADRLHSVSIYIDCRILIGILQNHTPVFYSFSSSHLTRFYNNSIPIPSIILSGHLHSEDRIYHFVYYFMCYFFHNIFCITLFFLSGKKKILYGWGWGWGWGS